MKAIKNCAFAFKTIFHYAPVNAVIYMIGFYVPAFFTGLQMILIQRIVDSASEFIRGEQTISVVVSWSCLLVLMLLLWVTLQRLGTYEMQVIRTKVTERMSPDIIAKLENLEYAEFENQGVQEVFQKMSEKPQEEIANCFNRAAISIQAMISMFFALGVYFSISIWIGIGSILIGIPMVVFSYYAASHRQIAYSQSSDATRRMNDLKELLANKHAMYEMKLFSSQKLLDEKWNRYSGEVVTETANEEKRVFLVNAGGGLLNAAFFTYVVCTVAYCFIHGTISIGQFTSALTSAPGISNKLSTSSWQVSEMFRYALRIDFFREFLKLKPREDLGSVDHVENMDIAFENVCFSYPETDKEILKNVTFYVKTGERIAFVGENGAGKSTIIKLLCGLYEPTAGKITIGGVPVREMTRQLRNSLLSVVFQDFQSYQMTLRENIAFGNLKMLYDDDTLYHALQLAGGEELCDGNVQRLNRNLGKLTEDGLDLSKGQWQRVAMARAFVSDANYVILDEPTASLDPIAESHMYENFARIFHSRGTIMISHRLASARMADRILVLDGGRIVQSGSHQELMQREGLYKTMYETQSSFYQEDSLQTAGKKGEQYGPGKITTQ